MSGGQRLRVDLLGPLRAESDGVALRVDTRKALAVLAVLACAQAEGAGGVSRDRLAALLWPDVDTARARSSLRRTLSVLVAATGPAVVAGRAEVGLDAERVDSDIVRLRAAVASDDPDELGAAVASVRGPFLDGFALRDSEAFESWQAQQADTVRRELGAVLERLVVLRIRHGQLQAALADTARWLELDPLHEPAHRASMRLLAWTGRRQDALDAYRRCVRVLADELGVAPVRATTAVHDAIRTGTLAGPPRSRRSADAAAPSRPEPPAVSTRAPMVGRDDALAALVPLAGSPGIAVITGEAGVGRTRLVDELVAVIPACVVVRAHEGEGTLSFTLIADLLRAALREATTPDDDLAAEISRVAPELLPPGRPTPAPLDSLGARDRFFDAALRVLASARLGAVVIEDVHAIGPAAAELVAYLVHRSDRLPYPLVLTWRDPGLPSRHPVRLALATGRIAPQVRAVRLGRLDRAEVGALCAAAGSDIDPDQLFAETDGLPMLLADAVRTGRLDVLTLPVRDVLAARLEAVGEETRQVLGALAVWGGVTDVATLRATSGRSDVETVDAVDEAISAGLVREEAGGVTFTHDALTRVAYDELSLARRRLLHGRAAESTPVVTTSAGAVARHWHAAGRDDLAREAARTAARAAADLYAHAEALDHLRFLIGLGEDSAEVAAAEGAALVALGRYEAALVAFDRAAELSAAAPPVVRARLERQCADVHARAGEWASADAQLVRALDLLAAEDEPRLRSQLLADRAAVALRQGADARDLVARAQGVDGADTAYVANIASVVHLAGGDTVAAVDALTSALAATDDLGMRAALLNNLAHAQAAGADPDAAVATAEQALLLGSRHGDRHRLAALHANLADRLHAAGQAEAALEHLKASAALFAEVGADPLDRPEVWTLTSW